MRRFTVGLLVALSVLCLVLSSTSLWTRRTVINTDVFVPTAEQVVHDPAVQARLTSQVVDTIMANPDVQQAINQAVSVLPPRLQEFRPSIEDGARNLLTRGVQALLTSRAFAVVTQAALTSAQTQLINGQSVTFDLGQAKALVPPQARTGLAGQVINLLPNNVGVTVLTKAQAPQVYTALDLLKSLWLWVGLAAIGLLVGALVLSRRRRATLRAWAVSTGVLGLVLVFAVTVAQGPLLARVKPMNVDAVDAVYGIVAGDLRTWTLWLVAIMAGIVVITLLWGRIGIVPGIVRGYHAVRAQAAHYRQSRAEAAETGAADRQAEPWTHRIAERTTVFVDSLGLPERFAALAAVIRRNTRTLRWTGIAVGALILVCWPSPTLSVLVWVAALVALYVGALELIMAIGARAQPVAAAVPVDAEGAVGPAVAEHAVDATDAGMPAGVGGDPRRTSVATRTAPTAPTATPLPRTPSDLDEQENSARRRAATRDDLSTMGSRLEVLMRLGEAYRAGILTEEEFAQEKAYLLRI